MNEARDHGTTGLRDGGGTNGKGGEGEAATWARAVRRDAATRATAARREAATRAMAARHDGGGVGERARATRQGTRMRPRPTALRKEAVGGILGGQLLFYPSSIKNN